MVKIRKGLMWLRQEQVFFAQGHRSQFDGQFLRSFGHPRALGAGMHLAGRAVPVGRIERRVLRMQRRARKYVQGGADQPDSLPHGGVALMHVLHQHPGILRAQPGDLLTPLPGSCLHLVEHVSYRCGSVQQVLADMALETRLWIVLQLAGIPPEDHGGTPQPLSQAERARVHRLPPLGWIVVACRGHQFDPV